MALTPIIKDNKVDIPSNMREGAKPTFQFNSTCGQDLKNGTYFATETILYGGIDDQVSSPLLVYPFDTYVELSESRSSLILMRFKLLRKDHYLGQIECHK